jgi:VanZ family protein
MKQRALILSVAYLGVILYLSLTPWHLTSTRSVPWLQWNFSGSLRRDLLNGIVHLGVYIPLGAALSCLFTRGRTAILASTLIGGLLSFGVEFTQMYLPHRDPSYLDLCTNTAGSLIGAIVGWAWFSYGTHARPVERRTVARTPSFRRRWGLIAAAVLLAGLAWFATHARSSSAVPTPTRSSGTPVDPMKLPTATTSQPPLTNAYNALNVPGIPAGGSYLDPTTGVKIYKLTSAAFPVTNPAARSSSHDYSEGGDEISLPYNGQTRAVLGHSAGDTGYYLFDFTPGVGVSNQRALSGRLTPRSDTAFAFSSNPATPYYAYVSNNSSIVRFDIRTMTEAPGNGWPMAEAGTWLHQSENDGLFTWMTASTIVGYEPSTGTRKTYVDAGVNEPRIDRAGRYIGLSMNSNDLKLWDWQANAIVWTHRQAAPDQVPFAHVASLRDEWIGVNWNVAAPWQFDVIDPIGRTVQNLTGPAPSTVAHCNGNWIQHPADLKDQWAVCLHYGSLTPPAPPIGSLLAPGGMVLLTANGQRRLLGHSYNTSSNYSLYSFAKFSSDGRYVLFTSDMNGSARSDQFVAELPINATSDDTTPPPASMTAVRRPH